MIRTVLMATLLLATTIALGGVGDTPELAPASSASCTSLEFDDVQPGCLEGATCSALEKATGRPWNCIE